MYHFPFLVCIIAACEVPFGVPTSNTDTCTPPRGDL